MNPFDEGNHDHLLPQIGGHMHQREPFTPEERLAFLEVKCAQLETAIRELCQAIAVQQQISNHNFQAMEKSFMNLVKYTTRPQKQIMGDQQDIN